MEVLHPYKMLLGTYLPSGNPQWQFLSAMCKLKDIVTAGYFQSWFFDMFSRRVWKIIKIETADFVS